jgi:hypothetical protein
VAVVVADSLSLIITPDADGATTINLTVTKNGMRQLRDGALRLVKQRFPTWSVGITGRNALEMERRHQMQIALRQLATQVQSGALVLR